MSLDSTGSESGVIGELGMSDSYVGVLGESNSGTGVLGESISGDAVLGFTGADVGAAVAGFSSGRSFGISGWSNQGIGVFGIGAVGAAEFIGDGDVSGTLTKGGGGFKIDHPLDPANKYLFHSFVESSDRKNVYDGEAVLDTNGEALVELPDWFETLNKECHYQLTPIGAPGPNLYIAEEVRHHRFKIAGGTSGMRVCWQVTGIRQDPWAQANALVIEQEKLTDERDRYLHPEVHGHAAEKSVWRVRHPEIHHRFSEHRRETT